MAINYTSPYERRARAQAIRAERESRRAIYNNRLNPTSTPQAVQRTVQNAPQKTKAGAENKEEANPLVRTLATAGDVVGNVFTGAAKGIEGVADFLLSAVGAVGGIFSSDFQEGIKDIVAYDAAQEWFGKPLNELTSDSYLTQGGFVENVASGIGQMLPAVAAAIPTGGSSLASLGTMAVSAAGSGTESAFQDGADYYAGLGYGVASGAVEAATEKMFGGATKAIFGKGVLDGGKAVASTGIKRIAKDAFEEGVEEVASELVNPALKGIYKGDEAFKEYTQGDYWKGVLEAGGVGAATALAYTGTVGNILSKKGKALSNRETDINDSLEAIGRQKRAAEQLFAENALTEANERKISANIRKNYENIQRALTKSKPEKRAELIEEFSLGSAFDSNGYIKSDFAATLGLDGNNAGADTRYYSPSLRGQEEYINQRLEGLGTRIYVGELTQEEQARYDKLKKVQNALSQKGLISSKLVLAEPSEEFDAFAFDDVIVIGKDTLESDAWQQKILHETVHFTEQTKEWKDFAAFILNETDTDAVIQSVLDRGYGDVTQEDADAVRAAIAQGNLDFDNFTQGQMILVSEAVAFQSEAMLGNQTMLEKLASTKTSLAHRILERIRHFIQVIRASSPEERKLINTLDNARRLLEKALNKAGSFYASEISAAMRSGVAENVHSEYNEDVENSQFSRKKASYIAYNKIGAEDVSYVREKLNELYSGIDDGVADGIAVEKGTTVYIVDSGKENGEISFGFKKKITISDDVERKGYLRRINDDAISRAFLSDGLSQRLGAELDKHRGSNRRYESREEFAADNRESQHNQSGISRTNGDRGRGLLDNENGSTGKYGRDRELNFEQNAGDSERIRFSRKKSFSEQVDDVLNGADTNSTHLMLSETPEILQQAGLPKLPILMTARHLKTITQSSGKDRANYHGLGTEIVKKLPQLISEPVILADSLTRGDSIVVITEAADSENRPVIAAILLDGKGRLEEKHINANIMTSAYGKDNFQSFLNSLAKADAVFYWDKKKSQEMLVSLGLQLPNAITNLSSNTIIRKARANVNTSANEEIKFSRKKNQRYQQLSPGQLKRVIANNTRRRVYSKADAQTVVNNILNNYMDFGDKLGDISGKTKAEVTNMLWESLNSLDEGKRAGFALDVADYIINEATLDDLLRDQDLSEHAYIADTLKPYLHTLDLSSLRAEIKNRYDGDNSIYLRWAKPNGGRGISVDTAAMELAGNGINIANYNPADILFELDDMYRKSSKALSSNVKSFLADSLDGKARERLRQEIAREVLRGFEYTGKASKLDGIIGKYEQEIKKWQRRYYDEKERNNAVNRVIDSVQKLQDFKKGTFVNASQYKSDIFKGSIEKLTRIKNRGNLNQSGTRRIMAGIKEWYAKDNPMLEGEAYSEEIAQMLSDIASNEKPFTTEEFQIISELEKASGLNSYAELRDWYTKSRLKEKYNPEVKRLLKDAANEKVFTIAELRNLANVTDYFRHFAETYNKIWQNGKWIDAKPVAEKHIKLLQENQKIKIGWMNKVSGSSYARAFYDPAALARRADLYEDGFYTQSLISFRRGAAKAAIDEMEILEPLEGFKKRNKKYFKALDKRTVQYNGQEIPAHKAMMLYLTLGREQAQGGLAASGFSFEQNDKTMRIDGFAPEGNLRGEALSERAAEVQQTLYEQFNQTDKEFVAIAREIFNKQCRDKKIAADKLIKGFSNIVSGEYAPIRRSNIARKLETDSWTSEWDSVSDASFNRDTVQGAKGELLIEDLETVVYRHVKGIALYANLAPVLENYNRLLNIDISGNPNKPISIATESRNVWKEGQRYFEQLLNDIKGIPASVGAGLGIFRQLRSGYALSVLGANPKVWVTQLTSFAAATSILDTDSIVRGLKVNSSDVDKYCPLAKLRNNDNTAAAAQGVLEKAGKIGNVLMTPIGKVDRFVIKRLFGACQVQIQKSSGLKIGTEQNKIKAGELLEEVIFETQQNALATERSAAMRSGSELMKTFTMFSSDAMKTIGRAIDGIGELTVLKQRRRLATDPQEIEYLDKRIKQARKKARKGVTALVTSSIFMALIAQLFRFIYNKDDEDDNVIENMAVDAVGNLLGGLPIIKDVYARFTEGYDLDSYAYSTINNLMDSAMGIFNATGDIISGKVDAKETARNVRNVLYSAGQLFGIPVKNMYNTAYGLTKRFSPSSAYSIDNMFYDKSYASDLAKAVEAEDDDMIATIAGIMLNENVGEVTSSSVRQELNRLIKAGYDVLPRSVGNSIIYDGEELALNNAQQREFKQTYSQANETAAELIQLSQYKEASEEVKAKAVNFIYDVYYDRALEKLLGVELDDKSVLFSKSMDTAKLAIILMTAKSLTADKDENGKSISGTKKTKIQSYVNSLKLNAAQKYMIMGYLGYSNENGSSQVKTYMQSLPLSKTQKEQLYAYSGYNNGG